MEKEHNFGADDIEILEPIIDERVERVGYATPDKLHPATEYHQRFSLFYTMAMFAYKGRLGPKEINAKHMQDQGLLDMIDRVNTVSRSIYEGTMSVNAAFEYLSPEKRKKTSPYMLGIYSSVSSAAFTLLFGGMPRDMIFAFFAAIVTNVSLKFFQKTTGYTFLSALFGSIVMASLSRVACLIVPEISLSSVITGGIIPMVPGLAMTNAVRDTINGDLVSGSSKAIEALLQAVAIAVGVSIVLAI